MFQTDSSLLTSADALALCKTNLGSRLMHLSQQLFCNIRRQKAGVTVQWAFGCISQQYLSHTWNRQLDSALNRFIGNDVRVCKEVAWFVEGVEDELDF